MIEFIIKSFCDLGGIQTLDLQNRNLTLYSAKLRDLFSIRNEELVIRDVSKLQILC